MAVNVTAVHLLNGWLVMDAPTCVSHAIDDHETTRTHAIRAIADQVDLLTDGLHALRHGSPAVADEFMDRALDALTRELAWLRDRTSRG